MFHRFHKLVANEKYKKTSLLGQISGLEERFSAALHRHLAYTLPQIAHYHGCFYDDQTIHLEEHILLSIYVTHCQEKLKQKQNREQYLSF